MFNIKPLKVPSNYDWNKKLYSDNELDKIRVVVWEARNKSNSRLRSNMFPKYTILHDRMIQLLCNRISKLLNEALRDRLIIGYKNFLKEI